MAAASAEDCSYAVRRIAEDDAPPPSRAARDVDRDLDAVVLKALARDPRLRYASAADFAADIRRYMAGRTVIARHRTPLYVALKWVRRHAVGVGVAAAVVAGAATAGTLYVRREHRAYLARLHQGVRQDVARQQAAANYHVALHAVLDLDALRDDLPADPAPLAARRGALERATHRLLQLAEGPAPSEPGDLDTAVALARVGASLELAGRFPDACDAYAEAAAIFERNAPNDPTGRAARALMTTHLQLGRLHLRPGNADLAAAAEHVSSAERLFDSLSARADAATLVRRIDRWRLRGILADLHLREQRPWQALPVAIEAHDLAADATSRGDADFSEATVQHSLKRLAQAHLAAYDAAPRAGTGTGTGTDAVSNPTAAHLSHAADMLTRALVIDRTAQAKADTLANRKELAVTLYELGAVRRRAGAYAEAEQLLTESIRWMEPLATADGAGEPARAHVTAARAELGEITRAREAATP